MQDTSMLDLGFTEGVREIPDWGIHSSASQGRGSHAFQDTAEGSDGTLSASSDDVCRLMECVCISVKRGESPNLILDSDLDQGMM